MTAVAQTGEFDRRGRHRAGDAGGRLRGRHASARGPRQGALIARAPWMQTRSPVLLSIKTRNCSRSCSRGARREGERSTATGLSCSRRSTSPTSAPTSASTAPSALRNTELQRRALTQERSAARSESLVDQGHKRVLLVAGESYPDEGFDYVLDGIATIYEVKRGNGEIRRVNVNVAPLPRRRSSASSRRPGSAPTSSFRKPIIARRTARVHVGGKKKDYDWRVTGMDRAMEAGIDDVGIGVLFGLSDWRFEMLAMLQHIRTSRETFGVGPHTISVPRIEPATGSTWPASARRTGERRGLPQARRHPASGRAVHRHYHVHARTADVRRETFALGVSQISAGSRTNPGGYAGAAMRSEEREQFQLGRPSHAGRGDPRCRRLAISPSFCTACYRLGRTGERLHGSGQARRDQESLRTQRPVHVPGVPGGLRHPETRRARRSSGSPPLAWNGTMASGGHWKSSWTRSHGKRDVLNQHQSDHSAI